MPVWHVSTSTQNDGGMMYAPRRVEAAAFDALRGVGGDVEWWIYTAARVGHLRVPVTVDENVLIAPGMAIDDAGETGPQRRRTR